VDVGLWTRAGEVERVASSRHAELANVLIDVLSQEGWVPRPEVSFNSRGERGLIDVLAWHPATGALLLLEIKTEIVDVGELFGTLDRKRRFAPEIARQLGFSPASISTALVVADTHTNHRRVTAHAATFGAVLPEGGQRFRAFIRQPLGIINAVAYWPYRHSGKTRLLGGGARRVNRPGEPSVSAIRSARKRQLRVIRAATSRGAGDSAR